jgi:hypothetical protein
MEKHLGNWHERIVAIFEAGKQFTEELLRENERLRRVNGRIRSELESANVAHALDVEALRDRLAIQQRESQLLRDELGALRELHRIVEQVNWDFAERHQEVERQNSSLLNIYVASQRLTATLEFDEMVTVVADIVINLIGSEHYEIVLASLESECQVTVSSMGPLDHLPRVRALEPMVKHVLARGQSVVGVEYHDATSHRALAHLPLCASDGSLGVIIIHSLLPHKPRLEDIDFDMFELLTERAGPVLRAAHWCSSAKQLIGNQKWRDIVDARVRAQSEMR